MTIALEQRFLELGGIAPLGKQYRPLSDSELQEIERTSRGRLPDDYRAFLQKYGGVKFSNASVLIVSGSGKKLDNLKTLFGGPKEDDESIVENIAIYRDRMPSTLIPIGEHWGNLVCLGVRGTKSGKVFYWDHETEVTELVANDFATFLLQLRLDDEPVASHSSEEILPDEPFSYLGGVYQSSECELGASDSQIKSIEETFGVMIPKAFKEFLKLYGGEDGLLFNQFIDYTSVDVLPGEHDSVLLHSLFGVDKLLNENSRYKSSLPNTHLMIGRLFDNSRVCLGIGGDIKNKIVYWARGCPGRVFVIANSFQDFISSLRPS